MNYISILSKTKGAFLTALIATVAIALLAPSCATRKDILYFQNIEDVQPKPQTTEYEAVIKKDDRLAIVVSGPDKTVTAPYNLTLGEMGANVSTASSNPENATLTYLVDPDGNINFPILGTIHVEGMTRNQLVTYLQTEIGKDVKDPIVYVAIKNYKITVLGEVRSPGTYVMDSEKITLLQALGRAGDLNLTAEREGILLIREENGVPKHYTIDLKSAELLNSPYFYLQQNDVVYVPASASRVATATAATGIWSTALSSVTTTVSLVTLIISLTRK
jgi:polysaccharide export outer membrane protein